MKVFCSDHFTSLFSYSLSVRDTVEPSPAVTRLAVRSVLPAESFSIMVTMVVPSGPTTRCTWMSSLPSVSFITRSVTVLSPTSVLTGAEMTEPSVFRMESLPAPLPVALVPGLLPTLPLAPAMSLGRSFGLASTS